MLFDEVGWVDQNEFSSGNGHLPFVETWLLTCWGFEFSQLDGSLSGHIQNDNSINTLNEEYERMVLWCYNINGWKVVDSKIGHDGWVDPVYFVARVGIEISTSGQIINHDFFDIPQDYDQIVSQKLDVLNFSFILAWEDDGRQLETGIILNIINKHFIRELLVNDCNKVSELWPINMESVSYQLLDLEVNVWSMSIFEAVHLFSIRNGRT